MTQGERIREVRKSFGLTLEKFGDRIGLKKNSVSQIENGKNELTDGNALAICREYNVNEHWLRTRVGEMFVKPEDFSLDEYAKARGATDLELEIMKAYFELDADIRKAVVEHFKTKLRIATDANPALLVPDSPEELEKLYPPVETGKDESNKSDVGLLSIKPIQPLKLLFDDDCYIINIKIEIVIHRINTLIIYCIYFSIAIVYVLLSHNRHTLSQKRIYD